MLDSLKALYLTTLFTLLAPISALAADIYISPSIENSEPSVLDRAWFADTDNNGCQIIIEGTIEGGDFEKMQSLYNRGITYDESGGEYVSGPIICLDSAGGSLVEAIKIAKFIRDRSRTVVLPSARCESACSIIFMAGSINGRVQRNIYTSSKLGFHAPELILQGSNYSAQNVAQAYDLAILTTSEIINLELLPLHALKMLTSTPNSSMRYIETVDDLLETQIGLYDLKKLHEPDYGVAYSRYFKKMPASSAEELIFRICAYSHDIEGGGSSYLGSYDTEKLQISSGDFTSIISGTAWLRFGFGEDVSSPCKASISVSRCDQNICHSESSVISEHTKDPRLFNTLLFWDGQTQLNDMDRKAMSLDQFTQLIRKHRTQSSCAVDKRSAEVTNVQNFTNLRHQAGLNGRVTGQVPLGATVTVVNPGQFLRYDRCAAACGGTNQNVIKQCIDNNDVWIEVEYNGTRGFLSRKFLE